MECPKDFLTLSLSVPNPNIDVSDAQVNTPVPTLIPRRRACQTQEKSETITPPFPWATNRRAIVHTYRYLLQNSIITITGSVQCKRCNEKLKMELDLEKKLAELLKFIEKNKDNMYDRAPKVWTEPLLPKCGHCGRENSVTPVLSRTNEKSINWLFLLLSQMVGCCSLKQLKYFCKHNNSHRTGAKDRLVYSTYMTLCNQLLPDFLKNS